ncbi:MAG: tripartite tricarboxylate transporter TctB family protein [Deltaproteobacteria bacterium]|nr:tripartite tricarboxylate transporter TctB family protein [Deltaproteobacteria bacterium]
MKNNDQRSSLFWLAAGLAIALYSGKYGLGSFSSPGPGFLPFLSGLAIAGLALMVFFQQFSKKGREKVKDLWLRGNWPTMLMVMGALVLYTFLFKFLGFLLDTFWLIAFLLRVMQPISWKKCFAGAILAAGGAYLIFQVWLKAQLPAGFLGF